MKRRSGAGGAAPKARRRRTQEPKRLSAAKVQARAKLSPATEETEVARLTRELSEERKQRTATSEVLHLLSGSHGDLKRLFDTILTNATKLCRASFGALFLCEADAFRIVAQHNAPRAYAELRRREPLVRGRFLLRAAETKQVVQIADVREDVASNPADKDAAAFAKVSGVRTLLEVPMLKDRKVVGAIVIYRQEVRTFNDREIELLKSFADQAVIAIENARLLNELRQRTTDLTERTADLTEALEQQTATSEVLQVISGSPGDLQPVFAAMLEKAVRICDAKFGTLYLVEDRRLRLVAAQQAPAFVEAQSGHPMDPAPGGMFDQTIRSKQAVQIADLAATEAYKQRHPNVVRAVELGGIRTTVGVPMLKDDKLIGVITIVRQEVRPFTDKQIALVTNFPAQAVIAIENARLLNELRQRTTDLTEALEQQTAAAEVLQVISSSSGDLEPVFQSIVENAARLCDAQVVDIMIAEGNTVRIGASFGELGRDPIEVLPLDRSTAVGRSICDKQPVQIEDMQNATDEFAFGRELARRFGHRTTLAVPLIHEGRALGAILIRRPEVRPFADKQIALVQNFAHQAVIAIENARLLGELRERTDEVVKLNQQLEQRVADQIGEIERMGRLRRFLPPQVADLIVASGAEKQLESHRREITALFCDLRGFTGFSESADPEDVSALLREYHAAIGEKIIKYSGTLERYAGDGVMVVFNDPVPVENPALQAVLMALEMRDAIGALTETWRRWGHDIGFGIGIAHGFATLGTIGFEGRFDYAAIGTVANVASRLCDEAKPGQILVSPRVLTKVEDAVTVEPVGEFALKGIRRPLAAYNVVATISA
jgi:class 3 adenylate cyclase/putative methionine-R-sulfoxide reductase with GAF domain